MNPDYTAAAVLAAETLVKFNVRRSPVSPLRILEQMDNVLVISFSEMSDISGISRFSMIQTFGKNRDALTTMHTENGHVSYVVGYNNLLPFNIVQQALARELAHIVLHHDGTSETSEAEAECFKNHLLCPRSLIHSVQATGHRLTVDLLTNLTGFSDNTMISLRHTPGTKVPTGLNRFVRSQFMPFIINFFDYYRCVAPNDKSAVADIGTYLDGYEE